MHAGSPEVRATADVAALASDGVTIWAAMSGTPRTPALLAVCRIEHERPANANDARETPTRPDPASLLAQGRIGVDRRRKRGRQRPSLNVRRPAEFLGALRAASADAG